MANDGRPLLAITMGDPAGIGPEIILAALSRRRIRESARVIIVGDQRIFRQTLENSKTRIRLKIISDAKEASSFTGPLLLDLCKADPARIPIGAVNALAGRAAATCIEEAVRLALAGTVAGIVTAPINKEALRLAGIPYPGHTEMIAAHCGVSRVAMMLVHGEMRVSHVTTHLAVRDACRKIAYARVLEVISLTEEAVKRMGINRPRIAVAGLNPHAGEAGLFGDEEIQEIAPAVAEARAIGIEVTGPLPADSVFARHLAGEFDAVVAMTHDHGHIAVKTVSFTSCGGKLKSGGVNLTLGLPIIRTSVDHGTAFDIAGRGIADPTSMVEAILLATHMSLHNNLSFS